MDETPYLCPGETHPISRAVHLSRLASHYASCRDCAMRFDAGHLPPASRVRLEETKPRAERKSLFADEGVRGIYLNELSKKEAHTIAAALAEVLWEQKPLAGRSQTAPSSAAKTRPAVLIGHDDRPAAPELISGVLAGLKRMGATVLDVGLSAKPAFHFAADFFQAKAGIYVSGANCPPAGMAIDFVGAGGRPISRQPLSRTGSHQLTLNRIEAAIKGPSARATRQAGTYRAVSAAARYQTELLNHFQALKPLKVCLATGSRLAMKTASQVFENLPSELVLVSLPIRVRSPFDPQDPDVLRLIQAVRLHQADVGVLVDDDAQRCSFLDESAGLVSLTQTTRLLAEVRHRDFPNDPIVLEEFATSELELLLKRSGMRVVRGGQTMAEMSDSLRGHHGSFGGGASGRYWFREAFPTSDAILALATIMKAITRANQPLSRLV